jgi:hypothetical protein
MFQAHILTIQRKEIKKQRGVCFMCYDEALYNCEPQIHGVEWRRYG